MQSDFVFTSESVTRGHPDKLCDQISDAVVDHFLRQDPFARVVTECAVSTGIVFISVKHVADATVDVTNTARRVIEDVGYAEGAFNARTCSVVTSLIEERATAERKLDERRLEDEELGRIAAGEQATVSGYACTHTPTLMPLPVWLANRVARHLDAARMDG
ncbi:MAG: S-adenosylmethionine synthetase N-terminal domain-containing protein, partial [Myxococcales bacterium]